MTDVLRIGAEVAETEARPVWELAYERKKSQRLGGNRVTLMVVADSLSEAMAIAQQRPDLEDEAALDADGLREAIESDARDRASADGERAPGWT